MEKGLWNGKVTWVGEQANSAFWDQHWEALIDESLTTAAIPWYLRRFVQALPRGARVLEAGCGTGGILKALLTEGLQAQGIDYAEDTVKALNQRGLPVRLMDVRSLDYPEDSFDAYISLGVIEHFFDEQQSRQALHEAVRIVKPGGRIFCSVPFTNLLRRRFFLRRGTLSVTADNFYQRAYTLAQYRELLNGLPIQLRGVVQYGANKGIGDEVHALSWLKRWPWKVPVSWLDIYTPLLNGFTHMIAVDVEVQATAEARSATGIKVVEAP
jgi:SAM-dependent methyltransferase